MTLDVLHFIDSKGGNAQEIRDSQKKRGLSVELVDEIIQMYADWVKSTPLYFHIISYLAWFKHALLTIRILPVDYDTNQISTGFDSGFSGLLTASTTDLNQR